MQITDAIMDPELGRSAFTVERLTRNVGDSPFMFH